MCCIVKCCNCHFISAGDMAGVARRGLVCVCAVGKMAKYMGMTIRKSIVVSFLPCLVAFLAFHPYMFFHFFKCFFCYLFLLTWHCNYCFFGEGGGGGGRKPWIIVVAQLQLAATYIREMQGNTSKDCR